MSELKKLPIIEETSLHEIVRRVKQWQTSHESDKIFENGKYADENFNLIFDPLNQKFLPICDYLEIRNDRGELILSKEGIVIEIKSRKSFYWEKWTEDTFFDYSIYFDNINFGYIDLSGCIFDKTVQLVNTSFNKFKIEKSNFKSVLYLHGSQFNSNAVFFSTVFDEKIVLSNLISFDSAEFKCGSDFNMCIFKGEADFSNAIFKGDNTFCNTVFEDKADFTGVKFDKMLDLDSITFKGDVKIDNIEFSENKEINLRESTFEKKLFFSLKDDTRENYGNTTLNLYHASIQDFVCDDRNLGQIKLWHEENKDIRIEAINSGNPWKIDLNNTKKDIIEQAIAERRVFRKILQDLNWGDLADLEYAKIMELQTDLEENGIKKWLTKIFFGWWLGWGVRILPDFHTDSWSDFWKFLIGDLKKGGIFLSSLLLAAVFTFILWLDSIILFLDSITGFILTRHFLFVFTQQTSDSDMNWFIDLINLIFSASAKTNLETIVVIFGFIQMNLFLVILARKFMRM